MKKYSFSLSKVLRVRKIEEEQAAARLAAAQIIATAAATRAAESRHALAARGARHGLQSAASFTGGDVPTRLPAGLSPAVDVAQQFLGVPYVWGGESPAGFDCSGLVQYAYGQLGVDLPRTAAEQARVGQPVASLADARPGDLLAFGDPVDHIGIYAGNGLMVVAPKTGDVVKVQAVYDQPTAIRRVLPPGGRSGEVAAQRAGLLAALSSFTGAAS